MPAPSTAINVKAASATGFTLVELVVVILLLGILSAYVLPRFTGRSDYDAVVARQDVKQALRLAQQIAMSRTDVAVSFASLGNALQITAGGVTQPNYPLVMPADVTLDTTTINFNHLGATLGGDVTLNISSGAQILRVCVDGATGYARDC